MCYSDHWNKTKIYCITIWHFLFMYIWMNGMQNMYGKNPDHIFYILHTIGDSQNYVTLLWAKKDRKFKKAKQRTKLAGHHFVNGPFNGVIYFCYLVIPKIMLKNEILYSTPVLYTIHNHTNTSIQCIHTMYIFCFN